MLFPLLALLIKSAFTYSVYFDIALLDNETQIKAIIKGPGTYMQIVEKKHLKDAYKVTVVCNATVYLLDTKYCGDIEIGHFLIDQENVQVTNDNVTIPDRCLYEKETYNIYIRNQIKRELEIDLVIFENDEMKQEVSFGSLFSDSITLYKPYGPPNPVKVYYRTLTCSLQYIQDVQWSDKIEFNESIIEDSCLPYINCFHTESSSDYNFAYEDLRKPDGQINSFLDSTYLIGNETFDTQIYLYRSPNCENNYPLSKYSSKQSLKCQNLTLADVPYKCAKKYTLMIINEIEPIDGFDYPLFIFDDNTQQYLQIEKNKHIDIYQYFDNFEVQLYTISSRCKEYTSIGKFKGDLSNLNSTVHIKSYMIPQQCLPVLIVCLNLEAVSDKYKYYYEIGKFSLLNHIYPKEKRIFVNDTHFFQIRITLDTYWCQGQTLGIFNASTIDKCLKLYDYIIPDECKKTPEEKFEDHNKQSRIIIISVIVVGVVLSIIIIIIGILVKRSRNKNRDISKSTTGTSLLIDNNNL